MKGRHYVCVLPFKKMTFIYLYVWCMCATVQMSGKPAEMGFVLPQCGSLVASAFTH